MLKVNRLDAVLDERNALRAQLEEVVNALESLTAVSEVVQQDCDSSVGFDAHNEWTPFFEVIRNAREVLSRLDAGKVTR